MSGIVGQNLGRGSGLVKKTAVAADAVTGSEIADDAIDSEHYTDGSIDNAHIADDAIDSEHYADGSIDNAHIADDAIDSEHYAAASIDNAHLADDAVDSDELAAGSVDTAHIADNQVTLAKMAGGTDGNIISYDASGDPVAIATGSDGQVLTSTGAGSPPAFEAAAAGGKVLQCIVGATMTSNFSMTSGTTADVTGMAGAITMGSTSNKLLVTVMGNFRNGGNSTVLTPGANIFLTDSDNNIKSNIYCYQYVAVNTHTFTWTICQQAMWVPGTTDAYTVKLRCNNGGAGALLQWYGMTSSSTFIFTEIEA